MEGVQRYKHSVEGQYIKELSDWKNNVKQTMDTDLAQKKKEYETEADSWKKETEAIKTLYEEQLRLKGPAAYWKELEGKYETSGRDWRHWAILTGVVGGIIAIALLVAPPVMLENPDNRVSIALKGAGLLVILFTGIGYLLKLFIDLSRSSYHLSRDARERYQLTHVFLALLKDKATPAEDREVVLQALFSRADTGLLKTDSAPTMPFSLMGLVDHLKK